MTMAWDPSFVLPATVRHVAQTPGRYLVLLESDQRLLGLLAEGLTNTQIGLRLHRSEKTVRNQLTGVYRRLGASNRAEAVALYLRAQFEGRK